MSDWDGFLERDTRRKVRNILVQNGFDADASFRMLLADVPPNYRASLGIQGLNGQMRLDETLRDMNKVVSLRNGQRPLTLFLENALDNIQDSADIAVIETALRRVKDGGAAETAGLAGAAPAAAGADAAKLRAALPDMAAVETGITQEALIGGFNETLPVSFLRAGLQASQSVFKLVIHSHLDGAPLFGADDSADLSFGTAWMIGPGLAITNNHVFNARRDHEPPASDVDYTLQVQTARLIADFHEADAEPAGQVLPGGALVARDAGLDFAIFKVPAEVAGRAPLALRRNALRKGPQNALGLRVNVLQHPGGGIMKLGFRNNYVVVGDNDILAYLTDTAKGSSGAPVMDDNWKAAALHAGSDSIGDMQIEILGTRIRRRNFGVPIIRIRTHLETHAPAVFAQLFP
ncbi:trypsin-like peptidase domain-containing protein [Puniceibacterium confluentis]|uniref:trypsin-like peptidase domain-containing protein n=1 Tax=Puniceibacterium confluentis TaxID=1958944 RepID=UPI0011B57C61|nr:trypsin-like peptidase domain-containing protein [Puniceibacterium confluentis]